jgi:hypothetical protein
MFEFANVKTDIRVRRWDADASLWVARRSLEDFGITEPTAYHFDHFDVRPYSVTEAYDTNLVTSAGWAALLGGVAGTTITTKFSNTAGRIGVGTSATAATAADTKLGGDTGGGSTTSYYQLVSAAPTITTNVAPATFIFNATFGTGVANFAWAEFGVDNGSASSVTTTGNVFFNHGISNQGVKASGQVWQMTVTLNCGYPNAANSVN